MLWVDLYEAGTTIATGAHILGETTPSIKHLNPRVQAAMDELESGGGELFDELDDLFASWKAA